MRLLIIIGIILYFLSPIDLLPDFLGPLGRVDDLGIIAFGIYHLRKLALRKAAEHAFKGKEQDHKQEEPEIQNTSRQERTPHEVLGIEQGASTDEIEKAYRELASQYHPDRVNHLGEELQELAHEKMIEITAAYEELKD